jgi:hypothetical protein
MALEQVFECPCTLRKLRRDPLRRLPKAFCDWLLRHGLVNRLSVSKIPWHKPDVLKWPNSLEREAELCEVKY